METSNQFQLELAIDGYLLQLQNSGNYTSDDILELKSHLLDNVDDLKQNQLNDEEAFMVAKKRLGAGLLLNFEYKKVNANVFLNRDLFVVVLSVCVFLLFYQLYNFTENGLRIITAANSEMNISFWSSLRYILQALIVIVFVYLVFSSRKLIPKVEKIFIKSPTNFTALLILVIVISFFASFFFEKNGFNEIKLNSKEAMVRYYDFSITNTLGNFVKVFLGVVFIFSIMAAFIMSYKRGNLLSDIVNKSDNIALFLLGVFSSAFAASARMLNGLFINNMLISILAFGVIWFTAVLLLNIYLRENKFGKNLVFISFGFIMELAAGIWINPDLKNGLPFSVYFIALVIGSGLGYWASKLIKRKLTLEIA